MCQYEQTEPSCQCNGAVASLIDQCLAAGGCWQKFQGDDKTSGDPCLCPIDPSSLCPLGTEPRGSCSNSTTTDCTTCWNNNGNWTLCCVESSSTCGVCDKHEGLSLSDCLNGGYTWKCTCDCPSTGCPSGYTVHTSCSLGNYSTCQDCTEHNGYWALSCSPPPPPPISSVCVAGSAEICECKDHTGLSITDCLQKGYQWSTKCKEGQSADACTCTSVADSVAGVCPRYVTGCSNSSTSSCTTCLQHNGTWWFKCQ